jgi:hypothetical protein
LNLRFDHIPLSFFLLRCEANESGQSVTIVRFISNGRTVGEGKKNRNKNGRQSHNGRNGKK